MEIALYYAPITCALAPYITLTEAGAKFEIRTLNFGKGQHTSPEYLKINPKHKVPLLIVDGRILSESVAIQTWIARTFPQAKLLPADPWQELQAISLMSWSSGGILTQHAHLNRSQTATSGKDKSRPLGGVRHELPLRCIDEHGTALPATAYHGRTLLLFSEAGQRSAANHCNGRNSPIIVGMNSDTVG